MIINTLINDILSQVKQVAEKQFGERLKAVRLYGSYARGEEREDSDIDILIVLDEIHDYYKDYRKISLQTYEIGFQYDKIISINLSSYQQYHK